LDGERDILGLWAGTGGEGAKFWMAVLVRHEALWNRAVMKAGCPGRRG
jgi:transposase-like protein